MRNGKWSGRDAEANGALRLFSPAAPGLPRQRRPAGARLGQADGAPRGRRHDRADAARDFELRARQRGRVARRGAPQGQGRGGQLKKAALAGPPPPSPPTSRRRRSSRRRTTRRSSAPRRSSASAPPTDPSPTSALSSSRCAIAVRRRRRKGGEGPRQLLAPRRALVCAREALKAAGNKKAAAEPSCRDVERVAAASGEANTKAQKTAAKAFGVDDEEEAEAEAEARAARSLRRSHVVHGVAGATGGGGGGRGGGGGGAYHPGGLPLRH